MEREAFYEEQKQLSRDGREPTKAVEAVQILIFNSRHAIGIQKRAESKKHNPGLFDKSVGGHVRYGEEVKDCMLGEIKEELNVDAIVTWSPNEFSHAAKDLSYRFDEIALIQHIQTTPLILHKLFQSGERLPIAYKAVIGFAVFDGVVVPETGDGEAESFEFVGIDELTERIATHPEEYSEDIRFFLSGYRDQIKQFLGQLPSAV